MTLKVFNTLSVRRVRIHKHSGVDNLDAWPAVKVSTFFHLVQSIVYLRFVRRGLSV